MSHDQNRFYEQAKTSTIKPFTVLVSSFSFIFCLFFSISCGKVSEPFAPNENLTPPLDLPNHSAVPQTFELVKVDLYLPVSERLPLFPHTRGTPPFQFDIVTGKGTIDVDHLSASEAGLITVLARDSEGQLTFINGYFHEKLTLSLSPATPTLDFSESAQVMVRGGLAPFKFSLLKNPRPLGARSEIPAGLSLDITTGVVTSGTTEGTAMVEVEDSMGTKAQMDLVVLSRAPGTELPTPTPVASPAPPLQPQPSPTPQDRAQNPPQNLLQTRPEEAFLTDSE